MSAQVTIASVIRQGPAVLDQFLCALRRLDPGRAELCFSFIDHSGDERCASLLADFCQGSERATVVPSSAV
jgi:hypothetical protein